MPLILTSVEFDHADIYKDLDAVETAFKRLVNLVPRRGRIVAFDTGESIERCLASAFVRWNATVRARSPTWQITNLRVRSGRTRGRAARWQAVGGVSSFRWPGEYNVWNATAAPLWPPHAEFRQEEIAAALKTFKSVKRRLEVRARVNGITIIDDFAHHPTAIAGTLTALRSRYPGSRLWAILEPRSNTLRRNVLQNELAKSLALADEVVVANVFKSEAIPEAERLDVAAVVVQISSTAAARASCPTSMRIVQLVAPEMRSGDVVAILSNGGFGGIYEKLPQRLKSMAGGAWATTR